MAELKQILHKIYALKDLPDAHLMKQLIDYLHVNEREYRAQPNKANENIQHLIKLLRSHPDYLNGLSIYVFTLLNEHNPINSLTDTGIISDESFYSGLTRLVGHRVTPLLPEKKSLVTLLDYLFDKTNDLKWLGSIDKVLWYELIELISVDEANSDLVATSKNSILNAMVILSYRISGIGLHQELMKAYPEMLDYTAAFVAQNQETVLFANEYRNSHHLDHHQDITPHKSIDAAPLLVMLEQCESIVNTVRKRIYKTGISIRLTNMLLRLEQSIKRMWMLSELLDENKSNRSEAFYSLATTIIVSVKRRYSIGYLIKDNTRLLSKKITENSGRVGEHYISTDKSGYFKMFKKAAIGGFIIAFMATLKILTYDLDLAPMGRAFVNSMIYGLGFVFIHIIHGTVATKQPAMTAAAIASTISESSGKKTQKLTKLSELMVDILRTQFVAIMGNVLIAMPLALIISVIWFTTVGEPMISTEKAGHLLEDLHPWHSPALFHAAIAGVYLFLAGLIAGYYDNLALFNKIGERIANHNLLLKMMPKAWVQRLGSFVDNNLGAIMSNFLFGVFLGSTATIGYIFGLPLDIRHIAFSSANFAHGMFNVAVDDFSFGLVVISLLGVALIGVINLMVSFSLAIFVAMRSKGVQFPEWKTIAKLMLTHLLTQPRDFFIPRPEPMQYANIDSEGYMIYRDANSSVKNKIVPKHFAVRRLAGVNSSDTESHKNGLIKYDPDAKAIDAKHKSVKLSHDRNLHLNGTSKPVSIRKNNLKRVKSGNSFYQDKYTIDLSTLSFKIVTPNSLTDINPETTNSNSFPRYIDVTVSSHNHKDRDGQSAKDNIALPKPKDPPKLPK